MASPTQEVIETFVGITGVSEAVALQKLEEHGGDLNAAINAHFNEGDRNITHATPAPAQNDFMDIDDDPIDVESSVPTFPLLSAARSLNPFQMLDSSFSRNLFDSDGAARFLRGSPRVSHPREVREIPIEVKDENTQFSSSGGGPIIEDVTGSATAHGPEVHGTVIIVDDDEEDLPIAPDDGVNASSVDSHGSRPGPTVSPVVDVADYNNDIEEEMIRAAIEASKRESEGYPNQNVVVPNNSTRNQRLEQNSPALEDDELAHVMSLSLKTAELERALREKGIPVGEGPSNSSNMKLEDLVTVKAGNTRQEFVSSTTETSSQLKLEEENLYAQEEAEDAEEQPLVRHRSRRVASGNAESGQIASPPLSPEQHDSGSHSQLNGDAFQTEEWGGISSIEHDDAVMLEAAMFGGIPERNAFRYSYPRVPQRPSPTLTAQRLLREQQDDEYLAALQADREKEFKAKQEAEAVLEKEKDQEEETRQKLLEEEEFERKLAAKEASLPQEPSPDDENAVTLLVRMPDASRCGRRFLKSDKLHLLFDYIDVRRVVKHGTYRLVRSYPRRAFTDEERELSLADLGLTGKQEALFLELI